MRRVAGCDLGKSSAKLVVGVVSADGFEVESAEHVEHHGEPLEVFRRWYRAAEVASCSALGATGVHAAELALPALKGLPEDACLEAALRLRPELDGPVNLVRIGARGYSVLVRNDAGRVLCFENDKCSAGTGETMVKIAGRFGMDVVEADRIASLAQSSIPITARCSVFAKSEMTHFGNQGRPRGALFRGYFASVANYVAALVCRGRVDGPIVVIGGCARIGSLVDALSEALDAPVVVPDEPLLFEALGAALLAAEQREEDSPDPLPDDPDSLIQPTERRYRVLAPARDAARDVERLQAGPIPEGAERQPSILGLDLGSTGSKAVLTSIETGEMVLDLYDRTRGNPVEAAARLVTSLLHRTAPDVKAVAVTGSGREAVATVMRAAWPQMVDRIVVINEIVAHATAAIRCDDEGGKSLSVVEIGGQDAKFIQIVGGQIVESDMNKACSAGTGSFLEEQAVFHGVEDIERFTGMASEASRPPDLGQMCTVFVAEAAADAKNEGFGVEDLFGGYQYSVVHNYINRVMGQRTFAERIFFQGKPATGQSLAWTLAAVTGRQVIVPANPGAMGAWGVGLCARSELSLDACSASFELARLLDAEVVGRSEMQCRDKGCATLCSIEKTRVSVGGVEKTVLSGGACPKYEISSGVNDKLPKDAPSAFDERRALLERYLDGSAARAADRTVGVPMVGTNHGYIPWLTTLLSELGLRVRVLTSDGKSLSRGEERCYSYDACAPAKIAHGVVDADVDAVFFPKILTVRDTAGGSGTTCAVEQGLPEMVRESLRERGSDVRVVHPTIDLQSLSSPRLLEQLLALRGELGVGRRRIVAAMRRAAAAQIAYERALASIGERTLRWARARGVPVVVVCGSLHVLHDPAVNAQIPRLLRENRVLALPMDCYPVPDDVHALPRIGWGDANLAMRAAVAARARGGVYPLLLTSFGCGPMSFVEHVFGALMEGYPHTTLESDGHGGTAGYVTRVQSFLHTVRQHDGRSAAVAADRLQLLEERSLPPLGRDGAHHVLLSMTDRLTKIMAAAYRSQGLDVVSSPPPSADGLALGRRDCSGKECLPYQLLWGAFRQQLQDDPPRKKTVLLQVSGEGRCRNCMFSVKDRLSLERLGLADRVDVRHIGVEEQLGLGFAARTWSGAVVWDLLQQLAAWYRPQQREADAVDRLYARFCDELEATLERPAGDGRLASVLDVVRGGPDVTGLVERASRAFADVARGTEPRTDARVVLLSGDVYVRLDDFAGDSLTRRLNERGLQVLVEPVSVITEYMAEERLSELMGLPTDWLGNAIIRHSMKATRQRLYDIVRPLHPWLPDHDVRPYVARSRELLDRYPQGEAPVTIGSVLHHHRARLCDGVVVASPWGCGPALVSESLLRHQTQIPMLFVYSDGAPIDERRLDAFAFRLRRTPRRTATTSRADHRARA